MIILAAIGGGALSAFNKLREKTIVGTYDQPLDYPQLVRYNDNDYLKQLASKNLTPLTKIGAFNAEKFVSLFKGPAARSTGKTMLRAAIGLPAFYMLAGTLQEKRRRDPFGRDMEGTTEKFFRKHPGIAATSFTFFPQIKDVAMGLIKKGSLASDIQDWAVFGALEGRNAAIGVTGGIADALLFNAAKKAYKTIKAWKTKPKNKKFY